MVIMSLYNLVDTFWVARLGYEAIAALTITLPYFILVVAVGVGTGVGANALASRRFGEGNIEATNKVAGQIFALSAFFGVIFLMAAAFFAEPIAILCGVTPDIMEMATQYLVVLGWGTPFIFFRIISGNMFRASGDAIKPMVFYIVGFATNIILDPFLIFGWGPFPEMGVGGAALATVIASSLSAGLSFYYIVGHKSVYRLKLHHLRPSLPVLYDIYRVGFPSMLMQWTDSVVFALLNRVLAGFGSVALAAMGITMRIADLAFMPIIGVEHGLLPIVGFCFGAGRWDRLWQSVKLASIAVTVVMGVVTVVFEIFAPQTIAIFSDDPELMAIGVPAMRIFLSTLVLVGPTVAFITVFQGLSKGKDVMVLSLVRQFVFFVPLLLWLPKVMGITGIWLSMPISDGLGFIVAGLWFWREYRIRQRARQWSDISVAGTEPGD